MFLIRNRMGVGNWFKSRIEETTLPAVNEGIKNVKQNVDDYKIQIDAKLAEIQKNVEAKGSQLIGVVAAISLLGVYLANRKKKK